MGREGVVRRGTSSSYIPLDFQTPTKFLISLSISHHHLLIPSNHHHLLMSALAPSSSPATTTKSPCSSSRVCLRSAHRLLLSPHRWRTAPTDPNRAESSPRRLRRQHLPTALLLLPSSPSLSHPPTLSFARCELSAFVWSCLFCPFVCFSSLLLVTSALGRVADPALVSAASPTTSSLR